MLSAVKLFRDELASLGFPVGRPGYRDVILLANEMKNARRKTFKAPPGRAWRRAAPVGDVVELTQRARKGTSLPGQSWSGRGERRLFAAMSSSRTIIFAARRTGGGSIQPR